MRCCVKTIYQIAAGYPGLQRRRYVTRRPPPFKQSSAAPFLWPLNPRSLTWRIRLKVRESDQGIKARSLATLFFTILVRAATSTSQLEYLDTEAPKAVPATVDDLQ